MLPESFFSFFQAFFLFRKVFPFFRMLPISSLFSRAFFLSENLSFGSLIFSIKPLFLRCFRRTFSLSKPSSFSEKFSLFRMLPTSSLFSEPSSFFRKPFSLGSLIFQFLTSLSDASGEFFSLFRAFFLFRKVFSLFRMLSISSLFSSLLPFRKSFLFGFFRTPPLSFPPPFLSLLV